MVVQILRYNYATRLLRRPLIVQLSIESLWASTLLIMAALAALKSGKLRAVLIISFQVSTH